MSNAKPVNVTAQELNEVTKGLSEVFKNYFILLITKDRKDADEYLSDMHSSHIDESYLFDTFIADDNVRAVQLLREAGIENDEIDMFYSYGSNHLLVAIDNNSPAMVKLLLDDGADVNLRFSEGGNNSKMHDSALLKAIDGGNLEIVSLILAKKPDVNLVCNGRTALTAALSKDRADMVVALLNAGAKVNSAMQELVIWQLRNAATAASRAKSDNSIWAQPAATTQANSNNVADTIKLSR